MTDRLTIGLSLSLTGQYAAMGRQAEAAIRLFVADQNAAGGVAIGGRRFELGLECDDDQSNPARCAEIYRSLCFENRAGLIFGPYSSSLARVAAPIAERAGIVMVNHGGADDDLYRQKYRLIVGILSPASDYLLGFARLLSTLKMWRKRLALIAFPSQFATAVIDGVEQACKERAIYRRGVRIRIRENLGREPDDARATLIARLAQARINALASAGSFDDDVALVRAVIAANLNIPVLACVAAGVENFRKSLGEHADGIIGPSQWEPDLRTVPELGLAPREFLRRMHSAEPDAGCDYPAAQIYAAGLLTVAALGAAGALDQERIRTAFGDLRTSTFYGEFALDRVTGRQIGHKVLLVQWHQGEKMIIHPDSHADVGALELPSGWRLILASFRGLRMTRGRKDEDDDQT
ncbi:MAG: ABC transporter substrate-binding protein [Candidatus Binataceae bacterium]